MTDTQPSPARAATPAALRFEAFHLAGPNGPLRRDGEVVPLPKKPLAVLWLLASRSAEVVTKDELLATVWPRVIVTDGAIAATLRDLRKVLGDDAENPRIITTTRGIGYRFIAEVSVGDAANAPPTARALSAAAPLPPPASADEASPLLVGREAEWAQLQRACAFAVAGRRQIVFVTGHAGLGKSSLAERFAASLQAPSAAQGVAWRIGFGQCIEHYGEGEPYLPVLEAISRCCRQPDGAPLLGLLRRYAPTWLAQLPAFADGEDQSAATQNVSPRRMLREMAEFLDAAAAEQPMLLVLEDMHWSDSSTVDLVAMLAQRREPARLLVLVTCRPVELIVNAHPLKQVKHERVARGEARELLLGHLSRAEVRAYMAQRRPADAADPAVADRVYGRSQGHPLFMAQLADDLRWSRSEPTLHDAALPKGITELIEEQLSRLAPEALALLEAACVAGAEFAAAGVAAALGWSIRSVEAGMETLAQRHQFIEQRGLTEWPDDTVSGRYGFGHDLYRETLYRRLAALQRVQFHALIGGRLEAAYGPRAGEIAAELAQHFECARKPRLAAHHRGNAAQKAVFRHASKEALVHASRGIALLMQSGVEDHLLELKLLLIEGTSRQNVHGYASPRVEGIFVRALELGTVLADPESIGPALSGLYNLYLTRADFDAVGKVARQVLERIEHKPEPVLEMLVHNVIGTAKLFADGAAGTLPHIERTLALYDPEAHHSLAAIYGEDPGVAAHHYAALVRWISGQPALADQHLMLGYAIAEQLRQPYGRAQMLWLEALIRLDEEEFIRVDTITLELTQLCIEHDFALWLAGGQILRGAALAGLGRFAEGRALTRAGLDDWRALGIELFVPHGLSVAARVEALGGQLEDALQLLEQALEVAGRTGERWYEAELHRRRGVLLRSRGATTQDHVALAARCFEQAIERSRQQGADLFEARAHASLAA